MNRRAVTQSAAALLAASTFPAHAIAQRAELPAIEAGGGEQERREPAPGARPAEVVPEAEVDRRVREYLRTGNSKITIYQVVEEIIDDVTADLEALDATTYSPLAIRRVSVTPNLSGAFASEVQARLETALVRQTNVRVKRCVSCAAVRTRIDGSDWVVTLGHVTQAELAREAERLGVEAFADVHLSYVPGANVVGMMVSLERASDGKIVWAEAYQSDATTAEILRTGDRVLTRAEARAELVRKLESRPYYGYQVLTGFGFIPYDGQDVSALSGIMIGGRLYEKFGEDRRFLYGFHGESFINLSDQNSILGAFLGATIQYDLNEPNLNSPTFRVGGIAQGFVAGNEGNSFALEALLEAILQFRYGASLGIAYFNPTTFAGSDLGGVTLKGRVIINW